jgi:preprotein translocase subunit SecA
MDVARRIEEDDSLNETGIVELALNAVVQEYEARTESVGERDMREIEKGIMLRQLDSHWKEHLAALDYLRQGIGLRSFAQRNPKQEYKREAFGMFEKMLDQWHRDTITILSKIQIRQPEDAAAIGPPPPARQAPPQAQPSEPVAPFVREQPKVGRNEPCPCGSGKKFKQCHGRLS